MSRERVFEIRKCLHFADHSVDISINHKLWKANYGYHLLDVVDSGSLHRQNLIRFGKNFAISNRYGLVLDH